MVQSQSRDYCIRSTLSMFNRSSAQATQRTRIVVLKTLKRCKWWSLRSQIHKLRATPRNLSFDLPHNTHIKATLWNKGLKICYGRLAQRTTTGTWDLRVRFDIQLYLFVTGERDAGEGRVAVNPTMYPYVYSSSSYTHHLSLLAPRW